MNDANLVDARSFSTRNFKRPKKRVYFSNFVPVDLSKAPAAVHGVVAESGEDLLTDEGVWHISNCEHY